MACNNLKPNHHQKTTITKLSYVGIMTCNNLKLNRHQKKHHKQIKVCGNHGINLLEIITLVHVDHSYHNLGIYIYSKIAYVRLIVLN